MSVSSSSHTNHTSTQHSHSSTTRSATTKSKTSKATGHSAKSSFQPHAARATKHAPKAKGATVVAHITSYAKKGQRSQMALGTITVNGRTYHFKSGGHARGNLPKGSYTVTAMKNKNQKGMVVDGVGYKYGLTDTFDPRLNATRTSLRIHPDGGSPGTSGCIGISGDGATQRQFQADMNAELARDGGHFTLSVE